MNKQIVELFYQNRGGRFYEEYAPTIRSERTGLLVVEYEEPESNSDRNA